MGKLLCRPSAGRGMASANAICPSIFSSRPLMWNFSYGETIWNFAEVGESQGGGEVEGLAGAAEGG